MGAHRPPDVTYIMDWGPTGRQTLHIVLSGVMTKTKIRLNKNVRGLVETLHIQMHTAYMHICMFNPRKTDKSKRGMYFVIPARPQR